MIFNKQLIDLLDYLWTLQYTLSDYKCKTLLSRKYYFSKVSVAWGGFRTGLKEGWMGQPSQSKLVLLLIQMSIICYGHRFINISLM